MLALFSRFPDGGDDFKMIFVLYALSVVLATLPDFRLRRSIYPSIANASAIQSLDLCSFVLAIILLLLSFFIARETLFKVTSSG